MTTSLPPGVDLSKTPAQAPPPGVTSDLVSPPAAAPAATAICVLVILLAVFFVTIRLYVNACSHRKLGIDDGCVICATVFMFGLTFCVLYLRPLARHTWDLPIATVTPALEKVIFTEEMLLGPSSFFGKCSLLLSYYRIFSPNKAFRYKIYAALVFAAVSQLSMIPIHAVLCKPPPGMSWGASNPNCSKAYSYALVQGPSNILLDLIIFYLPIPIVWRLNLPKRKRIGVLAIFMTGFIAIVAGIVAMVYRVQLWQTKDINWVGYLTVLCCVVQTGISIICSSMPAMAAFSKLHVLQTGYFTSLRSRLFSRYGPSTSGTSGDRAHTTRQGLPVSRPYASHPCENDSISRLHDNGYIELADQINLAGRPRTEIKGAVSQGSQERVGIQRSVRVEQSWHWLPNAQHNSNIQGV